MTNKKQRIGLDARMLGVEFTGIGRLVKALALRLPILAPEINWVFFVHPDKIDEFKDNPRNLEIIPTPQLIYSKAEQLEFLKILNGANLDLIHFPHFNVPLFYKRKFTTTIHDLTLFEHKGKKLNKWWHRVVFNQIFKKAVKKSRHIITVSEFTKSKLTSKYPQVNPKKIKVIYNGINEEFSNFELTAEIETAIRSKYQINEDFFFYTGSWREHKNLPRLVEAFAKLKKEGLKSKLVITGRADPSDNSLREAIEKLELRNEVILPGLVSDVELKALMQMARVFVFPSLAEGFGIPPLEAMASKTPVVAAHSSSIPEVCGKAAEYFDPLNCGEMAAKMQQVFNEESLRRELIAKGLKQIHKYNWRECAQATLQVIKKVLD